MKQLKINLPLAMFFINTIAIAEPPTTVQAKTGLEGSIVYADDKLDEALPPKVVILLDSSGSMGQLLGKDKSKMFYAKKLFNQYLQDQFREKASVGLLVYGSRKKEDCKDFYFPIQIDERKLTAIDSAVRKLEPVGMTPIAASLELAIEELKAYEGPKRIMIFTDGEETCKGDPCKVLESAMKEKVIDLEMFVAGIGMDQDSKNLDGLKCLGETFGAPDPKSLNEALDSMQDRINSKTNTGKNLFVECPNPHATVTVTRVSDQKIIRQFPASWGAVIEPGEYKIEVSLEPNFVFNSVKIPPKKKVTLKVVGKGTLEVKFFDGLLDVDLLDKNKKVVKSFLSDQPQAIPTGRYDIRISSGNFFERTWKAYQINPSGKHEIVIDGAGAVQVDYPSTVGIHIYNSADKSIGNHLTNFPFVIKNGTYRFFVNEKCNIPGITVRSDKLIQRLNCSGAKK